MSAQRLTQNVARARCQEPMSGDLRLRPALPAVGVISDISRLRLWCARDSRSASVETSWSAHRSSAARGQPPLLLRVEHALQLLAPDDAELAVGACQVPFHRLDRQI